MGPPRQPKPRNGGSTSVPLPPCIHSAPYSALLTALQPVPPSIPTTGRWPRSLWGCPTSSSPCLLICPQTSVSMFSPARSDEVPAGNCSAPSHRLQAADQTPQAPLFLTPHSAAYIFLECARFFLTSVPFHACCLKYSSSLSKQQSFRPVLFNFSISPPHLLQKLLSSEG